MRRSSEPEERAQFTVAELLARYGEAAPTTGRRHHRAAEDPCPTADTAAEAAAQPPVERDWAGTREPTIRPSDPLPVPDLPGRQDSSYLDSPHFDLFQSNATPSNATPSNSSRPHVNGRAGRAWAPAVGPSPVVPRQVPATPPVAAGRAPLGGTARSDGPVTDQLPRLDPAPVDPTPWSSRRPASAARPDSAYPASAQPDGAQLPAGRGTAARAIPEQNENATADEAQAQESGSPLWEWAVMVSQVGIGIVGGAALWLICEWLWQRIPVVALVVALAVITGLVWVVRRVRRAEDLQTTVIAVLVGLFVTVSPAALLLVGR
jgi:hypothetical protein